MTVNLTLLGLVYITRCGWSWPADRVVRLGSSRWIGSVSGHRAFSSCSHITPSRSLGPESRLK